MEEEKKMSVVEAYREAVNDVQTTSLHSAINDLRELGDLLEQKDVHFFEEEKFKEFLLEAKRYAKEI
jgi:hypothetical protein